MTDKTKPDRPVRVSITPSDINLLIRAIDLCLDSPRLTEYEPWYLQALRARLRRSVAISENLREAHQ